MTDYRIQSKTVFRAVLVTLVVVSTSLLATEVFVDLKSGSLKVYLIIFILSWITFLAGLKFSDSKVIRFLVPIVIFLMMEGIFFDNPESFQSIVYWFPFVPIIALITQGLRASQLWFLIVILAHTLNSIYLREVVGDHLEITMDRRASYYASIIFLVAILIAIYILYNLLGNAYGQSKVKNEELTTLKNRIEAKNNILTQFNSAMLELTRIPRADQDLDTILAQVSDIARDVLNLPRVSIWFLSKDKNKLTKRFLIDAGEVDDSEIVLYRGDYPKYFEALENKPLIMASIANTHPDTSEFVGSYLSPLKIKSMLDCPIVQDNQVVGVICCEQKQYVRNWLAEDALIVQSLADYIAMHFKNQQVHTLMDQLKEQNMQLSLKTEEIASMNGELHSLNQKLIEINDSLEKTVRKRTEELLIQNNQLKEYAFVNSHMLRAPLSSILGLSNLLQMKSENLDDQELADALFHSTNSLDQIVRKISSTLEDGSNLTRKDIDYIINERFKESRNRA